MRREFQNLRSLSEAEDDAAQKKGDSSDYSDDAEFWFSG